MVRKILLFSLIISLSGCVATRKQAEKDAGDPGLFSDVMKSTKTSAEFEAYNRSLAVAYLDASDKANQTRQTSNVVLLALAATIVQGGTIAAGTQLQGNRLLFGLALTEGMRYAAPEQVARAFRIAGEQAMCISHVIANKPSIQTHDIKAVMFTSNNNLRERIMVRNPVSITSLISGFKKGEAVLKEDNIILDNKLTAAKINNKDSDMGKLQECLL